MNKFTDEDLLKELEDEADLARAWFNGAFWFANEKDRKLLLAISNATVARMCQFCNRVRERSGVPLKDYSSKEYE